MGTDQQTLPLTSPGITVRCLHEQACQPRYPFFFPPTFHKHSEVNQHPLIGVIGNDRPALPSLPVFWVVFRDGFPSLRERDDPREGCSVLIRGFLFFGGRGGLFFPGGGGVSAADRQTNEQKSVVAWFVIGWDSHSWKVGPVRGCEGR